MGTGSSTMPGVMLSFLSLFTPPPPPPPSIPPSLSGAVYKGEWAEGLKEGRGTFTLKNGESFTGTFHRDRVSYRESPSTDLPAEEEVLLRPKTPLGTLIGIIIL